MKADAAPAAARPGSFAGLARTYADVAGQSALAWALVALLNLATQAIFFFEMVGPSHAPGEFGVFNAALGIVGLLTIPALAVPLALRLFFARAQSTSLDRLRDSAVILTENFAWVWGAFCVVVMVLPLPLPALPRFAVELFTLMNVLLVLGAVLSAAVCSEARQMARWALLLLIACLVRLVLGGWIMAYQPCAEAALAAYVVAGFVTLAPALRPRAVTLAARLGACMAALDRGFLRFGAATLSVMLGIYLFTNADRIASLSWWSTEVGGTTLRSDELRPYFDLYQGVGLLARALLWGTQPLLWLLYADRSKLNKTTFASLRFFWLYLAALVLGVLALGFLAHRGGPLETLLPSVGFIGPTFAAAMLPLGLIQGLGIFALASRRYVECFLIGGCGIAYALILVFLGDRPQNMLPYMFGASMVLLMLILFVGIVRYARKTP
jgi:hypothetical protein